MPPDEEAKFVPEVQESLDELATKMREAADAYRDKDKDRYLSCLMEAMFVTAALKQNISGKPEWF